MRQPNYPDQFKVKIGTEVQENDVILQTTQIGEDIHRRVIRTQEEQFREALISLGWTPPAKLDYDFTLTWRKEVFPTFRLTLRGDEVLGANPVSPPWFGDSLKSPIIDQDGSRHVFDGTARVVQVDQSDKGTKVYFKVYPPIT